MIAHIAGRTDPLLKQPAFVVKAAGIDHAIRRFQADGKLPLFSGFGLFGGWVLPVQPNSIGQGRAVVIRFEQKAQPLILLLRQADNVAAGSNILSCQRLRQDIV